MEEYSKIIGVASNDATLRRRILQRIPSTQQTVIFSNHRRQRSSGRALRLPHRLPAVAILAPSASERRLRPHDAFVHALGERALREAAVGAGHDVFAADHLG